MKNTMFIFKIGKLAVFIYKAKPFDIPKVKPIENFLKTDLENGGKKNSDLINEVFIKHMETDEDKKELQKINDWVGCYFFKYPDFESDGYEKRFMETLKMFLLSQTRQMYWHIFFARRLDYTLTEITNGFDEKREILLELDFPQFKDLKFKPRLLIFQRRTKPVFIFG